jgi:hypothetical protein
MPDANLFGNLLNVMISPAGICIAIFTIALSAFVATALSDKEW